MSDVRFCGFDHILKECLEEVGNPRHTLCRLLSELVPVELTHRISLL
jgi:hypothetical protein